MRVATRVAVLLAFASGAVAAGLLPAAAWNMDTNQNKIDDRIEAVHVSGIAAAFEENDPTKRMKIGVFDGDPIQFAIYVGYDHHPSALDEVALRSAVGPAAPIKTYHSIDYTRTQATYAQILLVAGLPGVTRVEAIPMMYALNHLGSRVVRARSSEGLSAQEAYELFPSAREQLGLDGTGIVIGVLDTGVNDAADDVNPAYPGHESLVGKFLGGGNFFAGNPLLNTPNTESLNPQDNADFHGTHVAGTAMGTGGQDGFFTGIAPAAKLVDCKVLSDAGAGFGSADAIDWCIFNKNRVWDGLAPGDPYVGIDVLNLSLGCLECFSDGTDAGAMAVNAGVDAGLIICVASGNDGGTGNDFSRSPGSADKAITVGATTTVGTIRREDDLVTDFSNEGPRPSDGDVDPLDEYKPNVVAPGAGTMSANGDWTSTGGSYNKLSGTSMACPHVTGVAALVKQANPALGPLQVRTILQNTALHHVSSQKGDRPADPLGLDPNYDPMSGWGLVDTYAAALEAMNSTSGVQLTRVKAEARPLDGEIDVLWWTQREFPFLGFNVQRAPDVGGAPAAFVQINSLLVAPAGDPLIQGDDNRTAYAFVDDDPGLVLGNRYWYRIEWVDLSGSHLEPAVPVVLGEDPRVATLFYSIKHNTPDNDLTVRLGTSGSYTPELAEFSVLGPGTAAADSTRTIEPANAATAATGYLQWYWSVGFTAGDGVQAYLPPSMAHPWFLSVTDDCFVNRTGTIESFSLFVNDSPGSPGGTTYVSDTPMPKPTGENCLIPGPDLSSTAWIPEQQPVQTMVRLDAEAETGGVRIRLELSEEMPGATAVLYRAAVPEFDARLPITEPLPLATGSLDHLDSSVEPGTVYWYWVELRSPSGETIWNGPLQVRAEGLSLARTMVMAPRPNPMTGPGEFAFVIGRDHSEGRTVPVRLTLHDERGRLVRTLVRGEHGVGEHEAVWDLRGDGGARLPRGIYFYRFQAGPVTRTGKVVLAP